LEKVTSTVSNVDLILSASDPKPYLKAEQRSAFNGMCMALVQSSNARPNHHHRLRRWSEIIHHHNHNHPGNR
jgi:hypothetical protein